ncbi:MAG: glycogen debranching N-terminal domain-containing protein [Guyparkeria sp.]
MNEMIEFGGQTYIEVTSPLVETATRVLKYGDTFAVLNQHGDAAGIGRGELGLYHRGTRHLSGWELLVNDTRPLLLSSNVSPDGALLHVDLTNDDLVEDGVRVAKDTLHIRRKILLREGTWYERLQLTNFGQEELVFRLSFSLGADFADIFEVRGVEHPDKPRPEPPRQAADAVVLGYLGADGVKRTTRITWGDCDPVWRGERMDVSLRLAPKQEIHVPITVTCEQGESRARPTTFEKARQTSHEEILESQAGDAEIVTSNEQFNEWIDRGRSDLHMLVTRTPEGPYPYAGVPWFSTPFGRDGLITALEYLWVNPAFARGVLSYLAATQATEENPAREAEPGKILHETRDGELAALGVIPFDRYYGTVDATPLFVMLAGAYYDRTGDRAFLHDLWPHVQAALEWIDRHGDVDGDGFLEYLRHGGKGLVNQGWKDSDDAIMHADGRLAEGPIALSEVQGYAYAAFRTGADLAELFGETDEARDLRRRARELKQRFHEAFWMPDLNTYALALDGEKRPCRVRSSNAGHLLFTGIANEAEARLTADTLLAPDSFSGWGIRTLAKGEARYNPMSYHNGSVWPHDTALIASGMARYGFTDHALQLLTSLFESGIHMDLHRMPELFCGFPARPCENPTLYPVACAPQAWSSAAPFCALKAGLGLSFHLDAPQIRFHHPRLPPYLDWIDIRNLRAGDGRVDIVLRRHANDVSLSVLHKEGNVEVTVTQ